MPFQQHKLTKSINQSRGIFDKYIYHPDNGDTIQDMVATDYFIQSRFIDDPDWNNSIIELFDGTEYSTAKISNGTVTAFSSESGSYPPASTGTNKSGAGIVVFSGNVTDSVAGTDLTAFVIAKHNNNAFFPSPIYDTGRLAIDPAEARLTNVSGENYSFIINASGKITSSSTQNAAVIGMRINSTGGVGTGTDKTYSAGLTQGAATVRAGYTVIGAFTLAAGESVWLEMSKSVTGTLVLADSLFVIEPIW